MNIDTQLRAYHLLQKFKVKPIAEHHILMIDDDVDFLQILTHLIDAMGYNLCTATSVEQGLDLAKLLTPDVIFCDLRLPGDMDGYYFARAIRTDTKLFETPLIAVTGLVDFEVEKRAKEAGFTDVFAKPVKFIQIKNTIERYVAQ